MRTIPAGDILFGRQRIELLDYQRLNNLGRAPQGVRHAVTLLNALTMQPQDGYFRDLAVFFGLKRAYASLDAAETTEDTDEASDILWRTALRAEYGGAADARRALEQAQRAVMEALAAEFAEAEVVADAGNGKVLAFLNAHSEVYRQEFRDESNEVVIRCHLPRHLLHHIAGPTVKVRFIERPSKPPSMPSTLG